MPDRIGCSFKLIVKTTELILLTLSLIIHGEGDKSLLTVTSSDYFTLVYIIYYAFTLMILCCLLVRFEIAQIPVILINASGCILIGACGGIGLYVGSAEIEAAYIIQGLADILIAFMQAAEVGYDMNSLKSLKI